MTAQQILVLVAGVAIIVAIIWYFLAPRKEATSNRSGTTQQVEIEVRGGYNPGTVRVKRGVPLQLVFNRQEEASCSDEIVIPDFGVRKFLAPFARTTVEIMPDKAGRFDITCGMSMLHGTLVVEA